MDLYRIRKKMGWSGTVAAFAAMSLAPTRASAQSETFYLDRIQVAGAPGDGFGVWRPDIGPSRMFGQFALGYAKNPLRAENIAKDAEQANALKGPPLTSQLTAYFTLGIEVMEKASLELTFPLVMYQRGYRTDNSAAGLYQAVNIVSPAPSDLRLDGRMLIFESGSKAFRAGVRAAVFLPSGNETSFTGDSGAWANLSLSGEAALHPFVVVANGGISLRPEARLNSLRTGSELTFGLGLYLPVLHQKLRLGAEFFGSAGQGTPPLEWSINTRYSFGRQRSTWVGLGAGTRLTAGYAPDARVFAQIGGVFSFKSEPTPISRPVPERQATVVADMDDDGVPDIKDACPMEPEDGVHAGDGCPEPADRDRDGIVDERDACPNEPEDKDGLKDTDGCPEVDADEDGFVDTADKCPLEPGVHHDDPAKEGCPRFIRVVSKEVELLTQVEFRSGEATILSNSFPVLDEVVATLRTNPDILLIRVEGYTDNKGSVAFNERLSQARAQAVRNYLVNQGKIDSKRVTFKGYGPARPIADNDTPEGQAKNRRVELHIVREVEEEEKK